MTNYNHHNINNLLLQCLIHNDLKKPLLLTSGLNKSNNFEVESNILPLNEQIHQYKDQQIKHLQNLLKQQDELIKQKNILINEQKVIIDCLKNKLEPLEKRFNESLKQDSSLRTFSNSNNYKSSVDIINNQNKSIQEYNLILVNKNTIIFKNKEYNFLEPVKEDIINKSKSLLTKDKEREITKKDIFYFPKVGCFFDKTRKI